MASISVTVRVDRPAEEVFAYIANPANAPEWHSTVVEAKDVTPPAPGVEARVTIVSKVLGKQLESTYRGIVTNTPHLKIVSETVESAVPHVWTYECVSAGGGTDVIITLEGEPGRYFRFAEPIVLSMLKRQLQVDAETLKALLEEPVVAPAATPQPAPGD